MPDFKKENEDILGEQLAPGLWIDANGNPHFSLPDILAHLKIEDTLPNRILLEIELSQWLKQNGGPDMKVIHRDRPPDLGNYENTQNQS